MGGVVVGLQEERSPERIAGGGEVAHAHARVAEGAPEVGGLRFLRDGRLASGPCAAQVADGEPRTADEGVDLGELGLEGPGATEGRQRPPGLVGLQVRDAEVLPEEGRLRGAAEDRTVELLPLGRLAPAADHAAVQLAHRGGVRVDPVRLLQLEEGLVVPVVLDEDAGADLAVPGPRDARLAESVGQLQGAVDVGADGEAVAQLPERGLVLCVLADPLARGGHPLLEGLGLLPGLGQAGDLGFVLAGGLRVLPGHDGAAGDPAFGEEARLPQVGPAGLREGRDPGGDEAVAVVVSAEGPVEVDERPRGPLVEGGDFERLAEGGLGLVRAVRRGVDAADQDPGVRVLWGATDERLERLEREGVVPHVERHRGEVANEGGVPRGEGEAGEEGAERAAPVAGGGPPLRLLEAPVDLARSVDRHGPLRRPDRF